VLSISTGLPRPRWRGLIHAWAFWLALPAVVWLLATSNGPDARFGAGVFGLSLTAVYGVSAAYHRLAHSVRAQQIMRRLDHSMIYVLIAGTYTPVCLETLPPAWRYPMLSVVWGLALAGIVAKVAGGGWWHKAGNVLYLVLGWQAIIALPVLIRSAELPVLILMMVGGVLYTVGAILFYRKSPDPLPAVFGYHEVWHTFTVLAGISHFAMVALVVG
jgi:hemolysin III